MILDFFRQKHECAHNKVPADVDEAYCPDCGALVKNKWYIVRCKCCNIKRHSHTEYKTIKPETKFCPNCGSTEFYVQELDKISFIDIPYTILKKETVRQKITETCQIWIEKEDYNNDKRKLISVNN